MAEMARLFFRKSEMILFLIYKFHCENSCIIDCENLIERRRNRPVKFIKQKMLWKFSSANKKPLNEKICKKRIHWWKSEEVFNGSKNPRKSVKNRKRQQKVCSRKMCWWQKKNGPHWQRVRKNVLRMNSVRLSINHIYFHGFDATLYCQC